MELTISIEVYAQLMNSWNAMRQALRDRAKKTILASLKVKIIKADRGTTSTAEAALPVIELPDVGVGDLHQEKSCTCPQRAAWGAWGACEACESPYATRSAWKRIDATRCAPERSARWVVPVNKKVDVSRARTMMHGGWHARSGARHNEHATSAYELRIEYGTESNSRRKLLKQQPQQYILRIYLQSMPIHRRRSLPPHRIWSMPLHCISSMLLHCISSMLLHGISSMPLYCTCLSTAYGRCLSAGYRRSFSTASGRDLSPACRRRFSAAYRRRFPAAYRRRFSAAYRRRLPAAYRQRFLAAYRRRCAGIAWLVG
jgi:hypothetical protein